MSGKPYRRCSCRDPLTGKTLGKKCPKLAVKGHALGWFFKYEAPRGADGRRRQPEVGPFLTEKAALDDQAATLARLGGGGHVQDRSLLTSTYLTGYAAGKIDVKPSTRAAIVEAIELYWKPAIGHLRLVDVRDHHIAEAIREMGTINRPLPEGERPSEMLRRMLAVRADDVRRELRQGESRHKKSTKPLSAARITRVYAVLHAAMGAAVPRKIAVSPCDGVILPRASKVRALPWTDERAEAFRTALDKQMANASAAAGRPLTTVEKQRIWARAARPSPVMVWLPGPTGSFLDYLEAAGERLSALFCLVAYCGLRRDEVVGLTWAEVNLKDGVAYIRETGTGDGPKSESGMRAVPLPKPVVTELLTWQTRQKTEKMAFGPADWTDNGRVFTRADGTAVPGQWVSVRFETLAYRSGLPPVRFHDLRHGAASMCKAAGLDTKYISALLGHSRTSFTDDFYVTLFPEVLKAAAEAAAATVPRQSRASD